MDETGLKPPERTRTRLVSPVDTPTMDERAALARIADLVPDAGDDAAVVDGTVVATDLLHDRTHFPSGVTRYTAGWRSVGAALSDIAAMGAPARAAVAAYAAPAFDDAELTDFVRGATDVCASVDARYVGGDLSEHEAFTAAATAVGETDDPVLRSGARPGEAVCVTGTLGRTAAALRLFEAGRTDRANELFRFLPRVPAGRVLGVHATAMIDVTDGLAHSLHRIAQASGCGIGIDWAEIPIDPVVDSVADTAAERRELAAFVGEDFELCCTVPTDRLDDVRASLPVGLSVVGTTRPGDGVTADGDPVADRGYEHGRSG